MDNKSSFLLNRCLAEDDNGKKCTNTMSEEEREQDGMCSRCADGIWHSMTKNTDFIIG